MLTEMETNEGIKIVVCINSYQILGLIKVYDDLLLALKATRP